MKNIKIVRNYSNAIYDIACQNNNISKILEDFTLVKNFLKENDKLYITLISPIIHKFVKIKILNELVINHNLTYESKNFFILLINNSRVNYFFEISDYFKKLVAKRNNTKFFTVISSKHLKNSEVEEVKELLNEKNQNLQIEYIEDKSIIGGIIITFDSIRIDYSLKGYLDTLKKI